MITANLAFLGEFHPSKSPQRGDFYYTNKEIKNPPLGEGWEGY